jgi:hypothetical protein
MANEIRIDMSDPAMAEALVECAPGETSTLTMDVTVTEKGVELVGTVDPATVEKYAAEEEEAYEEETPPIPAAPAALTAAAGGAPPVPPAAVAAVM